MSYESDRLSMLDSDQILISQKFVVFREIEAYHMQSVISSQPGSRLSTVPDKPVKWNVCVDHPDTQIFVVSTSVSALGEKKPPAALKTCHMIYCAC